MQSNIYQGMAELIDTADERDRGRVSHPKRSLSHTEPLSQEGLSCSLNLPLITQETSCDGVIRPSPDLWGADCRTKRDPLTNINLIAE